MAPTQGPRAPLEFGGPLGAAALLLLLPATMFHLLLAARSGPPASLPGLEALWSPRALLLWLAWLGLQAALYYCRRARRAAPGLTLRCGSGFQALVLTALLVGLGMSAGLPLGALPEMLLPLAFVATLTAFIFSLFLYMKAQVAPVSALAPGGNSGNPIYDFFLGRELNPRICFFDFKYFCELRPGLIGWVCWLLYVGDALWHEEAILTTMDITHDGFGFMLAFGDIAWVPFTYSLQAQFLLHHPQPLELPMASVICLINGLETISTATGRKLLVSGWWGMVRHPNYLGDLIMALAWSLPCGVSHLLPYFYLLYFTALLVHREARDERQCLQKYGLAWQEYCRRVPYRIMPYIY
uniref:Delta(14)-sterol reductase TM7SF2 n=1 Tax=Nomascus leucogenys TaxID=61853 RepID=A0A2I3H089_NOMLE